MKPPSKRELLLQNQLARCSVLLFRVRENLPNNTRAEALIIEIEHFFSEAKASLAEALEQEAITLASRTSVIPVETSGAGSYWVPAAGTQYPYVAALTEEEVFSPPSSGGITQTEKPTTPSSAPSPNLSFGMRLKSVLSAQREG